MRHLAISLILALFLANMSWAIPQYSASASSLPQISRIPSLDNPSDGSALQSVGPITLRWTNPFGTTQYQLLVAPFNGDGPGINLIVGDTQMVSSSSFTINPPVFGVGNYVLLPGMSYSWQIRTTNYALPLGVNASLWGPWSGASTFRTANPSSANIAPVSPGNGGTISGSEVNVQWQDSATDIFYYEVQVSTDPQFRTDSNAVASVWHNLVHGGVTNPPNSWHTPHLSAGTTYYWRVRPRVQGDGTPVSWSPAWSFKTQGSAPAPAPNPMLSYETQVLGLINQIRQANGLNTLSQVGELTNAARAHSADMAATNTMSHTGSDGSNPGDRETAAGYTWNAYGEIVAYGYNTPEAVVNGWMNSPSHKEVILYGTFQDFGPGLLYASNGTPYWTVDFGLRR